MNARHAVSLAAASVLLTLPLTGCALRPGRPASQSPPMRPPAVSQAAPTAGGAPADSARATADGPALDAELDAITRDLDRVDVPNDADFNSVDAGSR